MQYDRKAIKEKDAEIEELEAEIEELEAEKEELEATLQRWQDNTWQLLSSAERNQKVAEDKETGIQELGAIIGALARPSKANIFKQRSHCISSVQPMRSKRQW